MTAEIITMKSWWLLKCIKQRTVNNGDTLVFGTRLRHPLVGKQIFETKFTVNSSRLKTTVEIDPRPLFPLRNVTLTEQEPEFTLPGALVITHLTGTSPRNLLKR